jgi:hypothetical protein
MSKDRGFKTLVGRTIEKVKVTDTSILLRTDDGDFRIWLNSNTFAGSELGPRYTIDCQQDRKTTKVTKKPAETDHPFPYPPEKS